MVINDGYIMIINDYWLLLLLMMMMMMMMNSFTGFSGYWYTWV